MGGWLSCQINSFSKSRKGILHLEKTSHQKLDSIERFHGENSEKTFHVWVEDSPFPTSEILKNKRDYLISWTVKT